MPTLDELMQRSRKPDIGAFLADELYRLGYRSDQPQALRAFADAGRGGKEEEHAVADAVADYQRTWKVDLDDLALRTYGRELSVDGDPGQVTLQHLFNRTCGVPDRFYAEDGTLKKAEANWPTSCRMDVGFWLDASRYATYASSMGLTFEQFKAVFRRALDHIKSFAKLGFHVSEDREAARMYVGFERLGGSTLAWSHLANNSCGDKEQRYTVRSWAEDYLFLVIVHECLHAAGCPHTPGPYVMNPSIVPSLKGMTPRDVENLLSKGYEKADPKPPEDPDDPDQPDDPGDPAAWPVGWRVDGEMQDGRIVTANDFKRIEVRFNDGKSARSLISIGKK